MNGWNMRKDWNVPYWNVPSAQAFMEAEKRMRAAYERLVQVEEELVRREKQQVADELGPGHEPTDARLAQAQFVSAEWRQAWSQFSEAVLATQQLERQWREETAGQTRK
jgi:hypothetical protein